VGLANNSTFAALLPLIRSLANQWQVKCLLTGTNGGDLPTDEMQFFRRTRRGISVSERVHTSKLTAKEQPAGWLQQCGSQQRLRALLQHLDNEVGVLRGAYVGPS